MMVSDFCTMRCANCCFTDGLCYTSYPPKYRCTFDNNFYNGFHACHLDLAPVVHATWYEGNGWLDYDHDDFDNTIVRPTYICSNCKSEEDFASDYCPNCGAKMDLE